MTTEPVRLHLDGASIPPLALTLMVCSTVGGLLFVAVYLIEGVTRPGYDALAHPMSLLSLGPGGWVQQANFVMLGLVTLGCAVPGWRMALAGGPSATAYPLMRGIEGISLVVVGIFSQDPAQGYPLGTVTPEFPSPHAVIHFVFSFVTLTAVAVGCFFLARRLAAEAGWGRGWAAYAVLTGLLAIVFIAIFGAMNTHIVLGGLFERLSPGVVSLMGILIVGRLLLQVRPLGLARGRGRA